MALEKRLEEFYKERERCKLYKRMRKYIYEKDLNYCVRSDGHVITLDQCNREISHFNDVYGEMLDVFPEKPKVETIEEEQERLSALELERAI